MTLLDANNILYTIQRNNTPLATEQSDLWYNELWSISAGMPQYAWMVVAALNYTAYYSEYYKYSQIPRYNQKLINSDSNLWNIVNFPAQNLGQINGTDWMKYLYDYIRLSYNLVPEYHNSLAPIQITPDFISAALNILPRIEEQNPIIQPEQNKTQQNEESGKENNSEQITDAPAESNDKEKQHTKTEPDANADQENNKESRMVQQSASKPEFWNSNRITALYSCIISIINAKASNAPVNNDHSSCYISVNGQYEYYKFIDNKVVPLCSNLEPIEKALFQNVSNVPKPCIACNLAITDSLKEADTDSAIKHLVYFSNGDKNTFDKLCLDFVNSIMHSDFKARDTIVSGDLDKTEKWIHLIDCLSNGISPHYRNKPILTFQQFSASDIYTHKYYLHYPNSPAFEDKGNQFIHLEFPYGGEFYNLPNLSANEYLWLFKLLFAHGWHLLNHTELSRRAKTRDIEAEFTGFLERYDESNEIRIPAALIYQLYLAYAKKEKQTKEVSDSELYRRIEKHGIEYGSFKGRDADVRYIVSELKPVIEKIGVHFDDKWIEKNKVNKSFKCTIHDDFWKILSGPSTENNSTSSDSKFSKYIRELHSRYEPLFDIKQLDFMDSPEEDSSAKKHSFVFGTRYIER